MSLQSIGNAKDIFLRAVELADTASRQAYLDQACGANSHLRQRVEALLIAHERPESLLDHAALEKQKASDASPTSPFTPLAFTPGTCIGPYKIREQIGEGGMGTVFVAQQERPLRRQVALKGAQPASRQWQLARMRGLQLARIEHVKMDLLWHDMRNVFFQLVSTIMEVLYDGRKGISN